MIHQPPRSPRITIFIPTYKRPQLLKKAIQSALSQTYSDLQVIVCDNASSDETANIVFELMKEDVRLKYIGHPKNIGMLNNYRYCLSIVETEFFSFLSDDDLLLPSFCKTVIDGFARFPEIAFFAASTIILHKEQGVLRVPLDLWPREGIFQREEGLLEMIGKYPVPTTIAFCKKMLPYVTVDSDNPIMWDCDFLIQLAGQFPFAITKERCGLFFSHLESFSQTVDGASANKALNQLITRIDTYSWMDLSIKTKAKLTLQKDLHQIIPHAIFKSFLQKEYKKAIQLSWQYLHPRPIRLVVVFLFLISLACYLFPFLRYFLMLIKHTKKFLQKNDWKSFEEYQKIVAE